MDYEKKYNEALERARKAYNAIPPESRGARKIIEDAFPELRESEDEKIRKALVNFLQSPFIKENLTDEKVAPWIAYLEKQKEQKPAEWSDTDELVFQDICKHLNEEGFGGWVVLLNALRNGEFQPKQEWSEEDETRLTNTLIMLKEYAIHHYSKDDVNKSVDWLENRFKSLRPQPKQNVNDMITPNEKFFQWIYDRLVNVHKENPDVDYMISFKRRIEELSFDKPSWKPSEEQIKAIESCFCEFGEGCPDEDGLRSLYNDLKKLI